MGICRHCGDSAPTISDILGFCADCIRDRFDDVWPEIKSIHHESRKVYGLPIEPPRAEDGISCPQCFHGCIIPEGGKGYCGVRSVQNGKLRGGRPQEGNLSYYHDPLPTNCVADFVCPGGGDCGYPEYSVSKGPEYGYSNLAVFYQACSFNCLYCQNHHFRDRVFSSSTINAGQLASAVDNRTS
jgi:pyruvate formate lyase activating enzyme